MPELFSQVLDLKEKDVFLETEINDNLYFSISGLPSNLSYGKHPFAITYNDPNNQPLLKNLSNIVFEFVDSRGTVIFSNLVDISELSGAGNGFVWIKKDPLRTADEIADGPAFFYVMGELGGNEIPMEWRGIYNVRTTFVYDIRKDYPNTSPLLLNSPIDVQTNLNISESVEFDNEDDVFKRSFININLSNLQTNGGKIESVELAYNEQNAFTDDFNIITTYPLTSGSFETIDSTATSGLNPITNTTKIEIPKEFRRDTPVKFRLRFLNTSKQLAQYLDEDRQGEIVEVTSSFLNFEGAPLFIEREDNLLKGSMFTGNAVGKGFEQSGKNSAFLKTVDYEGFKSASLEKGSPGIMFFSGSVLTSSGDDYTGIGLELVANSESFFRFRSNPSVFDVRAQSFFVGSKEVQFISGSGGNIEISSSIFHLNPSNNILSISGTIKANAGNIGDFEIIDGKISGSNITFDANRSQIFKTAQGPGSDSSAAFNQLRDEYYIDFTPSSSNDPVGTDYYIKMGPNFMVDKSGILIARGAIFEGTVSASAGFLGGFVIESSSIRSRDYSVSISGSPTPNGFFISSSNFNVKGNGNITGSQVLFTGGTIGGFELSSTQINSTNDNLILKSSGQITASNAQIQGKITAETGTIGGFNIGTNLESSGGTLNLKGGTGQITGSNVLFSGGTIGGFTLNGGVGQSSLIGKAGTTERFRLDLLSGELSVNGNDAFGITLGGDASSGYEATTGTSIPIVLATEEDASRTVVRFGDANQFIKFDSGGTPKLFISSSNYFLGGSSQFISGSGGNIEISSSNFHLDNQGNVDMSGTITATGGVIGGFTINSDNLTATNFVLNTTDKSLSLGSGNTIFIADADDGIQLGHATFASAPFSVTPAGVLKATSGTIGGFTLSSTQITSNNLIIDSVGILQTSNFIPNLRGWRISSEGNGNAEFENVKIRGTISTAVFEKETINAVGGQLYVANSTTLTGSGQISESFATMSVANARGFKENEILSLKKQTNSGFTTEYILVQSSSLDDGSSDTNFAGKLFVQRGYGQGGTGNSSS